MQFRLRDGKDNDIMNAIHSVPKYFEKSDIIREALRSYFFNTNTPLRDSFTEVAVQPVIVKEVVPIKTVQPDFSNIKLSKKKGIDNIDDKFNSLFK